MELSEKLKPLIEKINQLKKTGEMDLSMEEDLSLAVMNLISLEEHLFFTKAKTGEEKYLDWLGEVRLLRQELLAKIINRHEHKGETWCVSKHLLATVMRLLEVGAKLWSSQKKKEAEEIFSRAYQMYSLFWALRLKLIGTEDVKQMAAKEKPWTLQEIVNKLVDCCDE